MQMNNVKACMFLVETGNSYEQKVGRVTETE
jgi:hypothetical protein